MLPLRTLHSFFNLLPHLNVTENVGLPLAIDVIQSIDGAAVHGSGEDAWRSSHEEAHGHPKLDVA